MDVDTTGRPLVSTLELLTRHTHVLWQYAHQHGAKSRPGVVLPQKSSKAATLIDSENEVYIFYFSTPLVLAVAVLLINPHC
jgi:hypothetical protein